MVSVDLQENADKETPWFHIESPDRSNIEYYPNKGQRPFHEAAGRVKYRGLFGGTGCLPVDALVWTPTGLKAISEVTQVISWNFDAWCFEVCDATYFPSGLKDVYIIETDVGELICSGDHRWFVGGKKVSVKRTTDLKTIDTLLMAFHSTRMVKSEQRSNELDGSLSRLSHQTALVRKIIKLEKQVEMGDLHVEGTHNFILFNGVITHNSGKTLAGIVEDCRWCLKFPGIVGYIFEPTYKMIDRIVVPTLNNLFGIPFWNNPVIDEFNRGRMNIRFYNGSTLWLVSLDDPEQAEGGNLDFAHADEARLVKPEAKWETAWRVILRRLRGSAGQKYPVGAWVTTTPNQPGSALYNFFENSKTKSPEAQVYRLHLDDNIHLSREFREGIKRDHSGSLYKRFVEGLFAGDVDATFAFDYAEHVQKFVEPKYGDIVYGVDFGWSDPTAVVAVMFDNDRRAFVVAEMYQNRMSDADIADKCHELQDIWGKGRFWCDPSSPDTIDFLRRERIDAKPGNRHRDEGIREIGGRLQDAGDGKHRLYVRDTCINLIDELQSYNEEQKGHDHAVDALRYCLLSGKRKREAVWGLGSLDKRRRRQGPW